MRFLVLLSLVFIVAGFILALTMGTLIGPVLVLAGVGSLLMLLGPGFERLGEILSTGQLRRTPRK